MRRIKKAGVVGGATVVLVAGGIAFAAWLSTGTGTTAPATAGSETGITVNAGAVPVTNLFPTKEVTVNPTVTNDNDYPVKITDVTGVTVVADATSLGLGCTAAADDVTATAPDSSVINALPVIDEGDTSAAIPIEVAMGPLSHEECQGAEFTVTLTVSAESAALP